MANKSMRWTTSRVSRETQNKIMRYHYTPTRTGKIGNTDNTDAEKDVGQQEFSYSADRVERGVATVKDTLASSHKRNCPLARTPAAALLVIDSTGLKTYIYTRHGTHRFIAAV